MLQKFDICIIGAGAGGLSVAAGAAQLGISVALIEGDLMGGDCLNYGCIPSKSLLSAAKHYSAAKNSRKYGFNATVEPADLPAILDRVKDIIKQIEPNDSIERFTSLGVKVFSGWAGFIDSKTVAVSNEQISARYFILATGARASIPEIPGLSEIQYLTNETIFSISETPRHLLVLGGGPIGVEIAQAFAMLGIKVSLIVRNNLLPKDDSELVTILRPRLLEQGISIYEQSTCLKLVKSGSEIQMEIEHNELPLNLIGSHLLIATGRTPNIQQLNLDKAQVAYTKRGISVNERLLTSNKQIFAIGDVIGGYEFTHIAGYHAGIIIRNILFRQRAKVNYRAVPWVTYTYPELAQVGLNHKEALTKYGDTVKLTEFTFAENDRSRTESETIGKIKLITNDKGKVLGVSVLGVNAGELLFPWIDLINRGESIKAITKNIIPYPTFSEINKQIVGKYYSPILFSAKVRRIVKFLKLFW